MSESKGNFAVWLNQQQPEPEPKSAEEIRAELWAEYHSLDIEDRNAFYLANREELNGSFV